MNVKAQTVKGAAAPPPVWEGQAPLLLVASGVARRAGTVHGSFLTLLPAPGQGVTRSAPDGAGQQLFTWHDGKVPGEAPAPKCFLSFPCSESASLLTPHGGLNFVWSPSALPNSYADFYSQCLRL